MKKIKKIKYIIKFIFIQNKLLFLSYCFLSFAIYVCPYIDTLIVKKIIDSFLTNDFDIIYVYICLIVAVFLLTYIFKRIKRLITVKINFNFKRHFQKVFYDKLLTIDCECLENPRYYNIIATIKRSINVMVNSPLLMASQVTSIIIFFYYSYVLIGYDFYGGILFIVSIIPCSIISFIFGKKLDDWHIEMIPDIRKTAYYRWMLTDGLPIRDMKLYDSYEYIEKKYFCEKKEYIDKNEMLARKNMILSIIIKLIPIIPFGIVIIRIFTKAFNNGIAISDIQFYVSIVSLVYVYSIGFVNNVLGQSYRFFLYYDKYYKFINQGENYNTSEGICLKDFKTLELNDVYFKYPNSSQLVLNGVSFKVNRGDTVCLLGTNGSGKSTVVKLILGLYKPLSGSIKINGIELEKYNLSSVREKIGTLFQNFGKYSLSLRESIAISDLKNINNDEDILKAIKDADLLDVFSDRDLETNISKKFDDNGRELSGGEWQKLALARMNFKKSDIIILDEPSASLDVEAEDRLFKKYSELSNEHTVFLISHRIFVGKMSSKILLLKDGKIYEEGTHSELMSRKGEYYNFYNFQMKKFDGGSNEEKNN